MPHLDPKKLAAVVDGIECLKSRMDAFSGEKAAEMIRSGQNVKANAPKGGGDVVHRRNKNGDIELWIKGNFEGTFNTPGEALTAEKKILARR